MMTKTVQEEDEKEDEEEEKEPVQIKPLEGLARNLMTIRTGTFTYSQNTGMLLPGYDRRTNVVGMDDFEAPGLGFILAGMLYQEWLAEEGLDSEEATTRALDEMRSAEAELASDAG